MLAKEFPLRLLGEALAALCSEERLTGSGHRLGLLGITSDVSHPLQTWSEVAPDLRVNETDKARLPPSIGTGLQQAGDTATPGANS